MAEQFIIFRGKVEPWIDDDAYDRSSVITEVSNDTKGLRQIIAFDLAKGTCRDATNEICAAVVARWAEDGKELSPEQYEFAELCIGVTRARSFRVEAV